MLALGNNYTIFYTGYKACDIGYSKLLFWCKEINTGLWWHVNLQGLP